MQSTGISMEDLMQKMQNMMTMMNTLQNQVNDQAQRIQSSTNHEPQVQVVEPPETNDMDLEDEEDDNGEGEEEGAWEEVFEATAPSPQSSPAQALVSLLGKPPSLDILKNTERKTTMWKNVPRTPAPRRNALDQRLYQPQRKMEVVMNLLITALETKDPNDTHQAAAYARSAWQDLQENRRGLIAGRARHKLEKRPDDTRPKLLSKEEEKEVEKTKRWQDKDGSRKGKGSYQRNNFSDRGSRSYSSGRSHGRGKGKGSEKKWTKTTEQK
jgi:hypothetical protein